MLRPDTQRLWDHLKDEPALAHFILVGGTALSMHLNHRVSEDLDFMSTKPRLAHQPIELAKRRALAAGFPFVANDNAMGVAEFEDTGLEYRDFQQDYIVAGAVKLTLVAPDPEVAIHLHAGYGDRPRIASLDEIFALKCMACADRSKSRDWLDLFVMLDGGLFQPMDIFRSFERANVPSKFDIAMMRLCSGRPGPADEGYEAMLPNPPSITQMKSYFIEVRNSIETEVAQIRTLARSIRPR